MNVQMPVVRPMQVQRHAPKGPRSAHSFSGAHAAKLAVFRSLETDRLGRAIGFPIAVVRIVDDPIRHATIMSETWHACWRASDEGWFMAFDFDYASHGSARFEHVPIDGRWMGRVALPANMVLSKGCLDVELPGGVSRSDLAQAFGQAMFDRRFDEVAQQPARVRQRFTSGRRLEVPCRYAATPAAGCDGRVQIVDDLYAFRPRALPAIVGALDATLRILSMCSALATAATTGQGREA